MIKQLSKEVNKVSKVLTNNTVTKNFGTILLVIILLVL